MIITFLGHSSIYNKKELFDKIKITIVKNIDKKDYVLFYCGGYGEFDEICTSVCNALKKDGIRCEIIYITPYITKSEQNKMNHILELKEYDSIIYPPLEKVPLKLAISKRNEWMVEKADLVIAYVKNTYGGAYNGLRYAQRKKKKIINLAE